MRAAILLALALTSVLLPSPQPPSPPKQLFFDDFNGPSFDRTRWNVVVTGARDYPTAAESRPAAVDVSTTLDPNSVRDSTCQTMLCFVTAIRATSPTWRAM
jgi:hypothetical protein